MRLLLPTVLITFSLSGCAEKPQETTQPSTSGATTDTAPPQDTGGPGLPTDTDDGTDEDTGTTDVTPDMDGDGYGADVDCDDSDADINPDADEVCDGVDNNCDGDIDGDAIDAEVWYGDGDEDGYGAESDVVIACDAPDGYVAASPDDYDCDDTEAAANPGEAEVCDGIDNDCDGTVDGDEALDVATFYADADGDGYGDPGAPETACELPLEHVEDDTDCDDSDADVNPTATEICDGVDNDCNGYIDGADPGINPADLTAWYLDDDGDGYGDFDGVPELDCEAPGPEYVGDNTDCDDADLAVNPGVVELCDGVDTDCDGTVNDAGLAAFEDTAGVRTAVTAFAAGTSGPAVSWTSSSDGTLYICEGTWYVNLYIEHDVDVIGPAGSADTVLDGDGTGRPLTVSSPAGRVTGSLTGLTLEDGAADYGGGLLLYDTEVALEDLVVRDNAASESGGGIYLENVSATLAAVTVQNNTASEDGGGLYALDSALSEVSGLSIVENSASEIGGGARLYQSSASGSDWELDNNTAEVGGGIAAFDAALTLSVGAITDNQATYTHGGGLYISGDSTVDLSDVDIVGNTANDEGGGISVRGGAVATLSGGSIDGNSASYGGGVYADGADTMVSVNDMTVDGNTVGRAGGGGYVSDSASLSFADCFITENQGGHSVSGAVVSGAGAMCSAGTLTLERTTVDGNATDEEGGGVAAGNCALSLDTVILSDNTADASGGGLYAYNNTEVSLQDSEVLNNAADGSGGGVLLTGGASLVASGNLFQENIGDYGGGLYVSSCTDVSVSDSTFTENTARDSGGGGFFEDAEVTLDGVVFSGNASNYSRSSESSSYALYGGGGLNAWYTTLDMTDVDFLDCDASHNGGGALFYESELTWSGGEVLDNDADRDGGGIYFRSDTQAELSGVTVADNYAGDDGGGFGVYQAQEISMVGVTVSNNTAVDAGGGGFNNESALYLEDCSITDNAAGGQGGGLSMGSLNAVNVVDGVTTTVSGNTSDDLYHSDAGASYSPGTAATFTCDGTGC